MRDGGPGLGGGLARLIAAQHGVAAADRWWAREHPGAPPWREVPPPVRYTNDPAPAVLARLRRRTLALTNLKYADRPREVLV